MTSSPAATVLLDITRARRVPKTNSIDSIRYQSCKQVGLNRDINYMKGLPLIYSRAWKTSATNPMAPSTTMVSEN